MIRKCCAAALTATIFLAGCSTGTTSLSSINPAVATAPTTAIQHVVVIFGENVSFDHYFATYPNAVNLQGEPAFTGTLNGQTLNGLTGSLLSTNPNLNAANGAGAANPFRLSRAQAATADQNHSYTPEQTAFDNGNMDLFPLSVGAADSAALALGSPTAQTKALTLGYYDGNTVTGLWNYAQHYSMSDNSFDTNFGPSTDGALNLISGQLNGVINDQNASADVVSDGTATGLTLTSDADPTGDICSTTTGANVHMTGTNIGDMLNAAGITWGFFEGGFDLTVKNSNGTTGCARTTQSKVTGTIESDYIPHHQPFQYYASTRNLQHLRPTSVAAIGTTDQANHQYDTHDFTDALAAGYMPAVTYLKAPGYQDGHAGYSDPLDEQTFVVDMVNAIQKSKFWQNTAIIINYDDSDGWYDHVVNIVNGSNTVRDTFNGATSGLCQTSTATAANALAGVASTTTHAQGRCGYGPRLPLMVISPWSKKNYIDHSVTDQTSVLRFIEDIFLGSKRIGQGSFDSIAGSLMPFFDFAHASAPNGNVVLLDDQQGTVTSGN